MPRSKQPIALQRQLTQAKYDADGFVTSYQAHLTEQQFEWLTWRMGVASDEEACEQSDIDQSLVDTWLADPEFSQVYQDSLANKREAFRYLSSQLIPKTLRTINALLDSESISAQVKGANLLLRAQGLLMDKRVVASSDDIARLREALLAPSSAPANSSPPSGSIIDVTPVLVAAASSDE